MCKLASALQRAAVVVTSTGSYRVNGHDPKQMIKGSEEPCVYTENEAFPHEDALFTFDEISEMTDLKIFELVEIDLTGGNKK